MKKLEPMFLNIVIQCKFDEKDKDFRSFAHVMDSDGDTWELRGYGSTAAEAAQEAWKAYRTGEKFWDVYGYCIKRKRRKKCTTKKS
jgi:hypothetical protein